MPDLVVVVRREDGKSARLDFYSQEGWKGALTCFGSGAKEISQASFAAEEVLALKGDLIGAAMMPAGEAAPSGQELRIAVVGFGGAHRGLMIGGIGAGAWSQAVAIGQATRL